MKHSYNDDSGIYMTSNENDAMEWNDVLSEVSILICYMYESELRMQSYGAANMGIWTKNSEDLGKIQPPDLDLDRVDFFFPKP